MRRLLPPQRERARGQFGLVIRVTPLLVRYELRVADNVDEEHVGDFQLDFFRFSGIRKVTLHYASQICCCRVGSSCRLSQYRNTW